MYSPIILLPARPNKPHRKYHAGAAYAWALQRSGAIPLAVFPCTCAPHQLDEILAKADGLLLPGGDDVHPLLYGQQPQPGIAEVSQQQDEFEMTLADRALRRGLPLLGICRGLQLLNVLYGGTLLQDIPRHKSNDCILHQQTAPLSSPWHAVKVEPNSRIATIYSHLLQQDHTLLVNSIHHQAIASLAKGWKITAVAPDGVIECIEQEGEQFVVAVQWHPEELPSHSVIFDAFVEAAKKRRC